MPMLLNAVFLGEKLKTASTRKDLIGVWSGLIFLTFVDKPITRNMIRTLMSLHGSD
jgi:hypothetical protein